VDEAGRGPLAGPVVAAAVVLPRECDLPDLRDSKCLSPAMREECYRRVLDTALCWAVSSVEADEIDRLNILRATHLAMARALARLSPPPHGAVVDGLPVSGLPCPHLAVVRGDSLSVSVAAASVLAKVTRDRLMRELDARYPGYALASHKGYSTPEHLRALRVLGPSPCHRHSFRPVARAHAPGKPSLFENEGEE
jgi:ribonuclease HII